ncbi:uncharacterized protein C8Q71DRAFT_129288 [Rhodofomes roseus]|uniref:Secreted protein n=1 Tax=Rhodofomes roseus TaxID=34475 RepID=A0ABQ8KBS4_9APHY|nr:uncharacterized protein C8Q71DRAFT_129288 [Rhodofomes roseus]KAH9834883.1 hypothetical protein C8Q71DRAFT_129288 [Rhodofomes roseus]
MRHAALAAELLTVFSVCRAIAVIPACYPHSQLVLALRSEHAHCRSVPVRSLYTAISSLERCRELDLEHIASNTAENSIRIMRHRQWT